MRPDCRIVEAQQQMEDRALAGAGRADDGDLLARAVRETTRHRARTCARTRRIGETDVVERDLAARRRRQRRRMAGRTIAGSIARISNSRSAAPEACATSPPDLRSEPSAPAAKHGVEHELAEPARRDLPAQHVLRADPQHDDDARGDEKDGDRGEYGARARSNSRAAMKARSTASRKARDRRAARW